MFEIIPAIDLIGGRCVRLTEGRYDTEKVFSEDPVEQAFLFEQQGATRLHVVDLEAARSGEATNWKTVKKIAARVSMPVELGGGIRSLEGIEQVFDLGVQYAILGSIACKKPELVDSAAQRWGERILVGIDARDGMVATDGWERTGQVGAENLAIRFERSGISGIIYTDIARDGRLSGPNLSSIRHMTEKVSLPVIASGGVSSIDDLLALRNLHIENLQGAIVGKALYEGRFELRQAIDAVQEGV